MMGQVRSYHAKFVLHQVVNQVRSVQGRSCQQKYMSGMTGEIRTGH